MYGYTMRVEQPISTYEAMHRAVMDVAGDDVPGLIVHFAHPTPRGFELTEVWETKDQLDTFTREVMPRVMQAAGTGADASRTELVEFDPVVVVTPRAYTSDRRAPRT